MSQTVSAFLASLNKVQVELLHGFSHFPYFIFILLPFRLL